MNAFRAVKAQRAANRMAIFYRRINDDKTRSCLFFTYFDSPGPVTSHSKGKPRFSIDLRCDTTRFISAAMPQEDRVYTAFSACPRRVSTSAGRFSGLCLLFVLPDQLRG